MLHGHPGDAEHLQRHAGQEHHRTEHGDRHRYGQRGGGQGEREDAQGAGEQEAARLPAGHQQGARDGARPEEAERQAPGTGPAQMVPGDQGAVDGVGRAHDRVRDGELDDDAPQPRPSGELPPALAQIGEHAAAAHPLRYVTDVEERPHRPGDREGRGVRRQYPAGPDRGHHGTAQRGTADRRALHRHPEDGERPARLLALDRRQQHALGRRAEERLTGAAEGGEQHHLPQLGLPGQDQHGESRLREAVQGVGRDHHPVPGEAVRDGAADQQEQHQRQGAGGGHQAHVATVAAGLQHRERRGDQRAVAAEVRDERGGGQQAVVAARPGGAAGATAEVDGGGHRQTIPAPAPICQTDCRSGARRGPLGPPPCRSGEGGRAARAYDARHILRSLFPNSYSWVT